MSGRAVKVHVTGRVQGVSFRLWMRGEAERLGINGWVRNDPDGSVTALVCGPAGAVAIMLERLWQGPSGAVVADVRAEPDDSAAVRAGFRITG